uniref:Glycine C-acetyltransferase n=1 Tax=Oncorhynchus tshawytscha TaxID=74940 RepID=A0A8C8IUR3_ONCTS
MCEPHLPDNWPWRDLKIAVQRRSPSNLTELESICREEWENSQIHVFKEPEYFPNALYKVDMGFCFFLSAGYTVGPKPLIDLLRQRSRPYLFSNSLPPPVVGCATRAVELLLASNEVAQSVGDNTMRFRNKMTEAGFTISGSDHPICPVMLGDARLASLMADDMLKLGVYVIVLLPSGTKGQSQNRVQISAAHTDQDIDHAVDAFIQTGREAWSSVP